MVGRKFVPEFVVALSKRLIVPDEDVMHRKPINAPGLLFTTPEALRYFGAPKYPARFIG